MSKLVEALLPSRLGRSFRWLVGSSWTSNIGDGIALAAGPLLVASQTDSAFLVALAAMLQRVPWLLFGLWAGALADRLDRRLVVIIANAVRALVIAVLCVFVGAGTVSIAMVLTAMFLYGIAEVFADTTQQTLLPALVRPVDLGTANQRMQAGFLAANQLVGPPLGAFLFAAGMVWPFVVQVVCVALAVVLVARITAPAGTSFTSTRDSESHVRKDIAEGLRWVWHHAPVRTLCIVILVFNITWAAPWGVLVKYSLDHLHMSEVGYGLLTTATGLGGVVGVLSYGWLERHVNLATLIRVCLTLEVLTHGAFALTTTGWVAIALMFEFGVYVFVWGTLSTTIRQRAVPKEFQGRVASINMICVFGGLVLGQGIGGVLAEYWGLVAPWWFAFAGAGVTLLLVWKSLSHVAHAGSAR
ncbi:putative arabinose efflux permease, MFS family [Promicromonospora umidemergens]|uniref:MFS family arabinose efflux permease n=1 Tax=Promicromonospora umidemergens TaxID=629679 RepID=A0ABP8WG70_9MICO|nr:MFS transporter [Promicromonospora umidemergens]MCP2286577.1 putative arabinose efflux permease, MFS family [Promicromonospora umidemergens]